MTENGIVLILRYSRKFSKLYYFETLNYLDTINLILRLRKKRDNVKVQFDSFTCQSDFTVAF